MKRWLLISIFILIPLLLVAQDVPQYYTGNSAPVTPSEFKTMKSALTESQKKLSTDLVQLIDQKFLPSGTSLQEHIESMKGMKQLQADQPGTLSAEQVVKSKVYVYIKVQTAEQLTEIESFASKVTDVDVNSSLVVAWVEVENLEKIASLESVRSIRTVMPPVVRTGSVTTEGDGIHKTSNVRTTYSQSGSGMKVGIISDGVDTRSAAQATSDLPADGSGLTVLSNTQGGDEGTAMLEIVHDMVPAADLYFHDCGANVAAFNSAIDDLVTAGCDVICDDIGWLLEPFYEDGTVASHVASVLSGNDIIYVSSAGNAGSRHYQGDYVSLSGGTNHDFSGVGSGTPYLYLSMASGSSVIVVLQWNDQFGSSGNDYDLLLINMTTSGLVAGSGATQDGNDDPLEAFQYTATSSANYAIIVDKYSGSAKNLEVYIYPNGCSVYINNISPVDAIYGHPAVVGAIGVGAIDASDPGNDDIESFSSQGPVTISYPSSTSRAKPDICGIDGATITGAGGFPNPFFGTSAAAPHVAAVCAQLWAQLPSNTGNQIRDKILATSVDLGTAGFDNVFGYGRADALEAFDTYVSVNAPTYSPPAGTYSSTQSVTVSSTTPSATIHYTLDGTDPTESDPTYSSALSISENTTLKARAYRSGWTSSTITSGDYDLGNWSQTQTVSGTGSYTFNSDGDGHDLNLNFTSLTGSGDVTVKQYTSAPPNAPCLNALDSYLEITMPGGITAFTANMTFNYTDADATGYTESDAWWGVARMPATASPTNTWQWLGGTVNGGSNQIVLNDVDQFSEFAVFRQIFGDYNGDGYVDVLDFQQFASVWHQTSGTEFTAGTTARFFNVNKDTDAGNQIIDVNDFQGFATVWHNGQKP